MSRKHVTCCFKTRNLVFVEGLSTATECIRVVAFSRLTLASLSPVSLLQTAVDYDCAWMARLWWMYTKRSWVSESTWTQIKLAGFPLLPKGLWFEKQTAIGTYVHWRNGYVSIGAVVRSFDPLNPSFLRCCLNLPCLLIDEKTVSLGLSVSVLFVIYFPGNSWKSFGFDRVQKRSTCLWPSVWDHCLSCRVSKLSCYSTSVFNILAPSGITWDGTM